MVNILRFSIRGLLAMVAIVACAFGTLCNSSPTALMILQSLLLGAVVVMSVLAMSGAPRTRRFCGAALMAGLLHWFVCCGYPFSVYVENPNSPTIYCCKLVWRCIKGDALGMSVPSVSPPAQGAIPPFTSAPPSAAYNGVTTASFEPLADGATGTTVGSEGPSSFTANISPPEAPPTSPDRYIPLDIVCGGYDPEWQTFIQVGILNATLLIGMFAGCATVMLDQSRRRTVQNRAAMRELTR